MSLPFTSPYFSAHRRKESPLIDLSSPGIYTPHHLLPALWTFLPLHKEPHDFFHTPMHLCRVFLFLMPLSYSSWTAISPSLDFGNVCPFPLESFWYTVVIYLYVSPPGDWELLQSRGPLFCASLHHPYCLTQSQHPRRLVKHLLNQWVSWIENIW